MTTAIIAVVAACFDTASADMQKVKTRECTIAASGVDFGIYDTLDAVPDDATGSVTYSCTKGGGAVVISIDRGSSGSFDRSMSGGADRLSYNLYLDVGHTRIWGDGSSGTATLEDKVPANGKPITETVYGRVFPRQSVASGRYTDALVVTMQF